MNNLNDPQEWNIRPERRGDGGDGNKWNYALLVPIIGLAAFRWIWSRESQREVLEVKKKYDKSMQAIRDAMDRKYKETLRENRQETIHLELELEKEKNRAEGYRQAIASQSQQLMEERRRLSQEREALTGEKRKALMAGATGALLHMALERESKSEWHKGAVAALREVEEGLLKRQEAFCSILVPREKRLEIERDVLVRVVQERSLAQLDMESDLKDIFRNDSQCAHYLNKDKHNNGSLMWVYLRYWQLQVTLQKHRRAEATLLERKSSNL
ncbi:coiled-coil domain-containing protein 127b [Esox lucius]|uniref:Coiled-coil domain containing 127a n=1 Tax=Esox lucius TaxID=8010 RepID=A0AAY5K465_ESOLU|nr:coiled-coil domain-containing protein 127b [Esox lucius]XP_034150704.1 coiled-coil domain-containing protein 127b [Esox lucius]